MNYVNNRLLCLENEKINMKTKISVNKWLYIVALNGKQLQQCEFNPSKSLTSADRGRATRQMKQFWVKFGTEDGPKTKKKIMQWPFLLWKYFYYFFGSGLESVGHSFGLCHPFCIFERCLDSNPESCYQLSQPSLLLWRYDQNLFSGWAISLKRLCQEKNICIEGLSCEQNLK